MPDIDIGVSYLEGLADLRIIEDFASTVSEPRLRFHSEERERAIYAGIEWFLPTVVFVFIARSYFDTFLKEMGKDHYHLLKKGVKALGSRLLGPTGPKRSAIGMPGKVSEERKYSIVYSALVQTPDLRTLKLLLRDDAKETEIYEAVDAFLDLCLEENALVAMIGPIEQRRGTRQILVTFNHRSRSIELVNPFSGRGRTEA